MSFLLTLSLIIKSVKSVMNQCQHDRESTEKIYLSYIEVMASRSGISCGDGIHFAFNKVVCPGSAASG